MIPQFRLRLAGAGAPAAGRVLHLRRFQLVHAAQLRRERWSLYFACSGQRRVPQPTWNESRRLTPRPQVSFRSSPVSRPHSTFRELQQVRGLRHVPRAGETRELETACSDAAVRTENFVKPSGPARQCWRRIPSCRSRTALAPAQRRTLPHRSSRRCPTTCGRGLAGAVPPGRLGFHDALGACGLVLGQLPEDLPGPLSQPVDLVLRLDQVRAPHRAGGQRGDTGHLLGDHVHRCPGLGENNGGGQPCHPSADNDNMSLVSPAR